MRNAFIAKCVVVAALAAGLAACASAEAGPTSREVEAIRVGGESVLAQNGRGCTPGTIIRREADRIVLCEGSEQRPDPDGSGCMVNRRTGERRCEGNRANNPE